MNDYQEWIGRTEETADHVTPFPVSAMSATLDRSDPAPVFGTVLPPLWHWLYFLPVYPLSQAGADGHARRGGFLPPVELPRRMWAGGRLEFRKAVRVGEQVMRKSTIANVSAKQGRTGALVFVLVRHEIRNDEGQCIVEEHDIVYRDPPAPGEPPPAYKMADIDHDWVREICPDPIMLFRYSALTFNGHRIHYDRPYATGVEGYPGLVVHGPLIATLLLDLLRKQAPEAEVARFSFRALKPLFDTAPFHVCGRVESDGKTVALWAKDADGLLAMSAEATLNVPLNVS